jgi:hypothetical protein
MEKSGLYFAGSLTFTKNGKVYCSIRNKLYLDTGAGWVEVDPLSLVDGA